MRENADQNKSEYGHYSRSNIYPVYSFAICAYYSVLDAVGFYKIAALHFGQNTGKLPVQESNSQ